MKTKRLLLCTLIAGILTVIFGGSAFATAGNTAEISGGKTWNICVDAGASYAGSDFVVNVAKTDFASQIVLGNGDCKSVEMAAGTYTASLSSTMGVGTVSYEIANDTLTFSVANSLRKYLNTFGSIAYTVEGSGEESPFELLFSMPGECQFNGNANVSGETCKDGDGNPLTNKKYIDTGVALFSEENAGKDFEIYFTLSDYASTQEKQGTLFNAKYENSSMYYPGFTIRTVNTDGGAMEITGRLGKDNTNADKANNSIVTADIKNKEVKIVRVGGMVSYSIDGGEMIPFQNYKNFSRYFNQTAVFGASMQTNGNPQRYYDGTIKNIRVYLKKIPVETTGSIEFQANGGTGSMATIEGIEVGTDVVLPMSTLSMNNANFTGWNTKSNGTGTAYADGATVTISEAGKLKLYAQWDGTDIAILDSGRNVNAKLKSVAGSSNKIKAIKTATSLPEDFDITKSNNIISDSAISPLPIYAWFESGSGTICVFSVATEIFSGEDMSYMFEFYSSLTDISAVSDWNTSNATGMGKIFYFTSALSDLSPVAGWDTSNVTDISWAFMDSAITDVDALSNWSVSNVVDMDNLFWDAKNLADISGLASWDTSSVKDMSFMFDGDKLLTDFSPISTWNTSSVENMEYMFNGTSLRNTDAFETKVHPGNNYVSWDVSNVKDMSLMFSQGFDWTLTDITALASWDTSSVEDMSSMFSWVKGVSDFSAIRKWNTSNVKRFEGMFNQSGINNVSVLETKQYAGNSYVSWDTSSATTMRDMFKSTSISNITALSSWDVSNVENMNGLFSLASNLSNISPIAHWNTSKCKNMSYMFWSTAITSVNALETKRHEGDDYVSWDVSNVTTFSSLFRGTKLSNISALASWNTSKAENMAELFYGSAIANVDALASWNVSKVKDMSRMFMSNASLTDISGVSGWNVSSVNNMTEMFAYSASIADLSPLDNWTVPSGVTKIGMFDSIPDTVARPLWY